MHPVAYPSAEEFLADTKRPRFDSLVLDIQLGGISGIELHQRLNAVGSTIPVIYVTARDELATRELALAAGCAAYFRKTDSRRSPARSHPPGSGPDQDKMQRQAKQQTQQQ